MSASLVFRWRVFEILLVVLGLVIIVPQVSAQDTAPDAVARLIIFHSPTCPHCIKVLSEDLPPLQARYGDQLEVRLYNLQDPEGYMIYQALHGQVPGLPTGVPQAYIDRYVLVGSDQIPRELPAIVDHCLATGGCDWPFTFEPANAPVEPVDTTSAQPVYLAYLSSWLLYMLFVF